MSFLQFNGFATVFVITICFGLLKKSSPVSKDCIVEDGEGEGGHRGREEEKEEEQGEKQSRKMKKRKRRTKIRRQHEGKRR